MYSEYKKKADEEFLMGKISTIKDKYSNVPGYKELATEAVKKINALPDKAGEILDAAEESLKTLKESQKKEEMLATEEKAKYAHIMPIGKKEKSEKLDISSAQKYLNYASKFRKLKELADKLPEQAETKEIKDLSNVLSGGYEIMLEIAKRSQKPFSTFPLGSARDLLLKEKAFVDNLKKHITTYQNTRNEEISAGGWEDILPLAINKFSQYI